MKITLSPKKTGTQFTGIAIHRVFVKGILKSFIGIRSCYFDVSAVFLFTTHKNPLPP
jgi:hypothetical protein